MKHRVFLIAVLFACMLGGLAASAEDARAIVHTEGKDS